MTDAQFSYDPATRTLRGILLPFGGERSRPNITGNEGVMFSADSIELPRDPSVVTLNRNHNRYDPHRASDVPGEASRRRLRGVRRRTDRPGRRVPPQPPARSESSLPKSLTW